MLVNCGCPRRSNTYLYSPIEPGGPIEAFLAERCARSMHFALRLWWLLDAEVGDNKPTTVPRYSDNGLAPKKY